MTKEFYGTTAMGRGFERNPVLGPQREQISRFVAPSPSKISVLDLGCGAGTTTSQLFGDQPERFRIVGADVSLQALAQYHDTTRRPGVRLDAQHLPFADKSFDVVVSDDVVEHLVDTDEYAREIHRVLVPNGLLLLTTPNLAAWFNRLALLAGYQPAFTEVSFERVFGRPGDDIVGHLRLFTSRSIEQFLVHHGFSILETRGARFDALPRRLQPLDALMARFPRFSGNTVIAARRATPAEQQS
jgi:SAM-dependent methyltransferase